LREADVRVMLGRVLADRALLDQRLGEPARARARLAEARQLAVQVEAGPDSPLGKAIARAEAALSS
jgi:hypothetical protein